MLSSLLRLLSFLPMALSLVIFGFGVVISIDAGIEQRQTLAHLARTGGWAASQMQAEFLRLLSAVDAFRANDLQVDADTVRERFELALSRPPVVLRADEGVLLRTDSFILNGTAAYEQRLLAMEDLVVSIEEGDRAAADALRAKLVDETQNVAEIVWRAVTAETRVAMDYEPNRNRAFLGLGLAIAGGFLMATLRLRSLAIRRRLRQEADKERLAAIEARARLVQSIETFSEGFALFDHDDRLVLCNARYRKLYAPNDSTGPQPGQSFEQIVRDALEAGAFHLGDTTPEDWIAARIAAHGEPESQHEQRMANGRYILVRELRTPDGGSVGIRIDVTQAKRREEELRLARDQAEYANRSKSEFLANMSHELRTPLNAILGFSEIMKLDALGPQGVSNYAEYAGDIHSSGSHLLEVINDILDLSKIEAGKMTLYEESIDAGRLLDSCLTLIRERAARSGIAIERDFDELPSILGDRTRLKQAFVNLMSNAVKFTPAGGKVTVRGGSDEYTWWVEISDTGIGMRPEDIPLVLQPFVQVDGSLSRRHEGTGLGLPITRSLIEMHDGKLEFESELGKGTTVRVVIPANRIIDMSRLRGAA